MSFNTGVITITDAAILDLGPQVTAGLQPDVATLDPVVRLQAAITAFVQAELAHLQQGTSFQVQVQGTLDQDGYGNWQVNLTIVPPSGGEGPAQ